MTDTNPWTEEVVFNLVKELSDGTDIDTMWDQTISKYADKLSLALWVIAGHGLDDDSIYSEGGDGSSVFRINRFVVLQDSQGFVNTRPYDKVQHAQWAMDDIRRDMNDPY
jgi:hypothetical protein